MDPGDALSAALERLPGVLAATILPGPDAGRRVYLAARPDADPENLRLVVARLLGDHGLECPPENVHIGAAPLRSRETGVLPTAHLESLEVQRVDDHAECTVALRTETRTTRGSARDTDTPTGRARAAVHATLAAAQGLDPDLKLGLAGLRVLDLFGHEVVALVLEATSGRAHAHLPGIALHERSVEESACRAALSAIRGWTTR